MTSSAQTDLGLGQVHGNEKRVAANERELGYAEFLDEMEISEHLREAQNKDVCTRSNLRSAWTGHYS